MSGKTRVRAAACLSAVLLLASAGARTAWGAAIAFPVRTDGASRTFVDAGGKKVFVVGDAAWSLMVQLTQAEVQQYLDDRRARGFNAVLVNLIEHKFADAAPANRYGQAPFTTPGNFATPNGAYFDNAEWVVSQAEARGMLVLLAPMYLGFTGSDEGWYTELVANGAANDRAYGRYVGQRFAGHPNIVWVHGGDQAPNGALALIEEVVAGIKEFDTVHLHTAHSAPGHSSLDDYNRPWLGANAIYARCNEPVSLQSAARQQWVAGGAMPNFHIEGYYEGEYGTTAQCWLDQIYYPALNGARGHVFGNNPIWKFASGWPAALGSPGAQYVQHAASLFAARDGAGLVPDVDQRIVTGGSFTASEVAAARMSNGGSALVYVPRAGTLQVDTSQLSGSDYVPHWFDPRTGQDTQIAGRSPVGATTTFTTPAGGPWLLLLDNPALVQTSPVWHPFFAVNPLETPYVGDFNGDGKTDIITFTRQNPLAVGDVYVALSNGHEFVDKNGNPGSSDKWHDWFAINTSEQVVIGDFDGDGKDDIATWLATTTRQVYVARSLGTSMTKELVWVNAIGFGPTDVLDAGDVNGDGRADLVLFARSRGEVYVALSTGTSFEAPQLWHSFFAVSTYERPRVADVTGDGKADIVTFATDSPTATGDVYVAVSNGTRFQDLAGNPNSSTKWHDWFAVQPSERVRIGDIDGDGKEDFFTFMPPPFAQAYTVVSMGDHMGPNVLWPDPVAPNSTDVPFVGDANGDGKADIIVFAQGEGKVYVSLGR